MNILSSPSYSNNFLICGKTKEEILDNMYEKLNKCGKDEYELVNKNNSNIVIYPIYCNNRSCSCPDCQNHRLYLYLREHYGQIMALSSKIKKPYAFVFTGWKKPVSEFTREFISEMRILVEKLLKKFNIGEFSIHTELKVYNKNDKNNYGMAYLHFHIVTGGINNLATVRMLYGRQIKYEKAIKPENLGYYVSKYASKTPYFENNILREYYHLLIYKQKLHIYSIKKLDIKKESNYYMMDMLMNEVRRCLYKDSYLNPLSKKKYYFSILENKRKKYFDDYLT